VRGIPNQRTIGLGYFKNLNDPWFFMKDCGFVVGYMMMFCFFSNKKERTVMLYVYIRSGSLNFLGVGGGNDHAVINLMNPPG
jgi:hypothetical protein